MLRRIAMLCAVVVFLLPAALTAFRGPHFGFKTWQEAMHVDTIMGMCIWAIFAIWMAYPLYRKTTENTELHHKKA